MIIDENSKPKDKLKAWYLFTEDFVAGTQALTNEEIGIYIRLLCYNWNKRCSGIPSDNITYYRIASCHTHNEKQSCDKVINQFFILVNEHYQNERQLQEYLYINKRIEASKINGKLGGRPKKPSQNPPTPTTTPTNYPKKTNKVLFNPHFKTFWDKVSNKVSKGIAEKNYLKLEEEWLVKPEELAKMYNDYYNSVEDKQFVKQPAFWLSAKKYLDENPKKKSTEKIEQYEMRLKMFVDAVEKKQGSAFIHKYAKQHSYDVLRAIKEGHFTKQQAVDYLDMGSWV
tara:strand:+ start:309 stop:1160 length:852 start_codon:yes stop_codon:yes gene_type:complete